MAEQTQAEYDSVHKVCPSCASTEITRTHAGRTFPGPDQNGAKCESCKWAGICDDLKPFPPKE